MGLSVADQRLYERSLITGYQLKVTVNIQNLDGAHIANVSSMLVDGQVNHSFMENVSYSASLTLMDPDNLVGFDTSSPSDNALYADRQIRIYYSVYSDLLPLWVDCPIFTGPVTKVTRDDAILSVECQGKEALSLPPFMIWTSKTYRKGTRLVSLVRDVMARSGETRFTLPEWSTTIPKDSTLTFDGAAFQYARDRVAPRMRRQLFYDGRGVLRLRSTPTTPYFTFTENHLLSVPKLDYNHADVRNTVLVRGGTPEGKPQIISKRYVPLSDPSSAEALKRGGIRRHLVEEVEDSNLMTQAAADAQADETLAAVAVSNVGFDFDSFPIPHLEPGDVFHLSTRDASINLRMGEFSIPLKAGNPQSNGTTRKISANRARIRRR